jgi:hypothetical protein
MMTYMSYKMTLTMPPVTNSQRCFLTVTSLHLGCDNLSVVPDGLKDHVAFTGLLLGLLDPEDEGNTSLGNVGDH